MTSDGGRSRGDYDANAVDLFSGCCLKSLAAAGTRCRRYYAGDAVLAAAAAVERHRWRWRLNCTARARQSEASDRWRCADAGSRRFGSP